MIPILIAGIVIISILCVAAIINGPTKGNETVNEIAFRLRRQEQQERENERRTKMFEEERKRIQDMEIQVERARYRLASEQRRVRAEMKGKKEEEDKRMKEEDKARRKIEEEKRDLANRILDLEKKEKAQKEAIEERNREQAMHIEAQERFGGPLRWPTREEFQETLRKTQYDRSRFHFAIVGRAGSGKSSLINAFRNLGNKDAGASKTGTTETTLEIGRYPDPGIEPPRQWMVWFDVPGAGTQRIPHQDYFVNQGLYVFDLIILAIGDRFEEIDARIIDDCARFKIPAFIVRSKADMHISNSMQEYGDYAPITDNPSRPLYRTCRDTFVKESQQTVTEGLARQNLPDQAVYVVSRDVLRRTYNSALHRDLEYRLPDWAQLDSTGVIHERHLVKEVLTAAAERRCETDILSVTQVCTRPDPSDLAEFLDVSGQTSGARARARESEAVARRPATATPASPRSTGQPPQHVRTAVLEKPLEKVRKVIYLRAPTDADNLYREMLRNDPELGNMLVEKPRMFSREVAMLEFYPLAPIPHEINVFGGMLRVKEYEERERRGGGGGGRRGGVNRGRGGGSGRGATTQSRGGYVQTATAGSAEGEGNTSNRHSEMTSRYGQKGQGRGK